MTIPNYFWKGIIALVAYVLIVIVVGRLNSGLLNVGRAVLTGDVNSRASSQLASEDGDTARRAYGLWFAEQGFFRSAGMMWQAMDEPPVADFIWLAEAARLQGDYANAMRWYERVASIGGPFVSAADNWYRGGGMALQINQHDQANRLFSEAIRANDFDEIGVSDAHYQLGVHYHIFTKPPVMELASLHYEQALDSADFSEPAIEADTLYGRGEMNRLGDQLDLAIADYEQALALDPTHHWAQLQLGVVEYAVSADFERAQTAMQTALNLWPEDASQAWPLYHLGVLFSAENQPDEAHAYFLQAQTINPTHQPTLNALQSSTSRE